MNSSMTSDTDLLRHYLLGELDDEAAGTVELRLLADDSLFELAEAVEGDLLTDLAHGALSREERSRARRRLAASPRGRARLALIAELARLPDAPAARPLAPPLPFAARTAPPPLKTSLQLAALAASLLVAAGGIWLATQTVQPNGARALLARNGEKVAGSMMPAVIADLPLDVTRSAAARNLLTVPPRSRRVEIHLRLREGEPFTSYRAVLLDANGRQVWQREERPQGLDGGQAVVLEIAADQLPPGEHEIKLYGLGRDGEELVGASSFEVRTP